MVKTNNYFKTIAALAVCIGITGSSYADSIARGQRGPTEWQADIRLGFAEKENVVGATTKSIVNNNVFKYWNGFSEKVTAVY